MPDAQGDDSRELAVDAPRVEIRPHAKDDARARGRAHGVQEGTHAAGGQRRGRGVGKAQLSLGAQFLEADVMEQAAADGPKQRGVGAMFGLCLRRSPRLFAAFASADARQAQGDVSREGVQRDLLPLIEGTAVSTKHGMVKTDHILFICSGAFHLSKPSDLLPELQGRLPIRVELKALNHEDFVRILTEPEANLIEQYVALMKTENFDLKFEKEAIDKIADIAVAINENVENIGARRLHTVLEILLEDISYTASDRSGEKEVITAQMVEEKLAKYTEASDLSKFIL